MICYTNTVDTKPHLMFPGRWCPFHKGHEYIIRQEMQKNPNMPILILIRDTAYDEISAIDRVKILSNWMIYEQIEGTVMIIPDIHGVYYGRKVGYEVESVDVPESIQGISATEIRERIRNNDTSWKDFVPESVITAIEGIYAE